MTAGQTDRRADGRADDPRAPKPQFFNVFCASRTRDHVHTLLLALKFIFLDQMYFLDMYCRVVILFVDFDRIWKTSPSRLPAQPPGRPNSRNAGEPMDDGSA